MREYLRPLLGYVLTLVAIAWMPIALTLCFVILAQFWRSAFGNGAFWAAVTAFGACFIAGRRLLDFADHLVGYPEADPPGARPALLTDRYVHDWPAMTREMIRNKRWAHYRRTRQFERLAALEREEQAEEARGGTAPLED